MGSNIRKVFSVTALLIIATFIYMLWSGTWSPVNWGMLLIALLSCLLVFVCFLYIFNYSYALCAVLSGALIVLAKPSMASVFIGSAAIAYGIRMIVFSWQRQVAPSYAKQMRGIVESDKAMPLVAKVMLYLLVTWLMAFHLMALWFVADSGVMTWGVIAGGGLMWVSLMLETIADEQKKRAKAEHPERFVTVGLFRRWRHPNFLGEIGFQVGLMLAGLSAAEQFMQGFALILGPLYIVILMVAEARRTDQHQLDRYGQDPAYQAYYEQSGSLFPR